MKYVIYQNEVQGTYELLSHGLIWYVPMNMSTEKAHKYVARKERNEKIKQWILAYDEVTTFIAAALALLLVGLLHR